MKIKGIVKHIWYEGNDLHIITDKEKHYVFKNTTLKDIKAMEFNDNTILTEKISLKKELISD